MAMIAGDREQLNDLLRERRRNGLDRHDEVWDGVYVLSPLADPDHQFLLTKLSATFDQALADLPGAIVYAGLNVSDLAEGWRKNYRVSDVAVFLPGNPARKLAAHYQGGPDFVVEVVSPRDRSRRKFEFCQKIGTKELLIVDRKPWSLELYRADAGSMILVGKVTEDSSEPAISAILPLSFRMIPGNHRPTIEVTQTVDARRWLI